MDCDTTGIEPDFALVIQEVAGGGYFRFINRAVPRRCACCYGEPTSPRSKPIGRPRLDHRRPPSIFDAAVKGFTPEPSSG